MKCMVGTLTGRQMWIRQDTSVRSGLNVKNNANILTGRFPLHWARAKHSVTLLATMGMVLLQTTAPLSVKKVDNVLLLPVYSEYV